MTDLVRLSCLLLLDLGFKDSWINIFNFFYYLFLNQYFTKRNNSMVSRIWWPFMTLVLFIFVNLVFFCPKMILRIISKYREIIFKIALVFTFVIKGIIYKIWNFLYYWSDLTEIFTQYVKSKKKNTFCSWKFFRLGLSLYIYIYIL